MYDYLFVCSANVGRSQMAQGFYNSKFPSGSISVAAIEDVRDKYKDRAHPGIISIMSEVGIDISDQSITLLSKDMFELVERVVVFCDVEKCPTYLQDCSKVIVIPVDDPYELQRDDDDLEVFRVIRDQINGIVKTL